MGYVTKEQIDRAAETDLLTYLRTCEPHNLVRVSVETYCTAEHDSLRISNGKWYWFSRGVGGHNALQYLVVVNGYTLPEAVNLILGKEMQPERMDMPLIKTDKELTLPPRAKEPFRAVRYLKSRGIHPDVISYCIDRGLIYETADRHHNVVFLGLDQNGKAKYAGIRATTGSFRIDAKGSDKSCPFCIPAEKKGKDVHVFEAAIDLMSWASLERIAGRDWRRDHLISLAGVSAQSREGSLPPALEGYLQRYPKISTVHLHLDNDAAGRSASRTIARSLKGRCAVVDEPPIRGKDYNDYLMEKAGLKDPAFDVINKEEKEMSM